MSREVDERVVSMKFDNDQFEKGVKQTTSTLDKLKQALNFKGAGKDINALNGQFAKVNFNPMTSGIQAVNAKLSLMQQISMAVVERMTNAIIDATGKFANMALQINGMRDGFQEYELQMNSIQTIMANTQKYGTTLEDVKKTLGELNEYADKTVYVFSDMTNAIGKFTTAGVSLEDSTAAIKGMSNFAATVSADNTALARAEYQVSQALASGKFNLMDWRSLENAGMGGAKMQDTLKQVARDFGINVDAMITKAGSFRDSLSEKKADGVWLTSDVFLEAMKRFADDPTMIDAATKVRTFSKMLDTLKESIGTGWADTWQKFIGDFNEATELFTTLKDFFNMFIEGAAKARNAVLQDWVDAGGRSYGVAALYNVITNIVRGFEAFKAGFAEIFPPETGQTLAALTKKFFELTVMLKNSPERLNAIQMAGRNVGVVCKTLLTILQSGIQLVTPFINVGKVILGALMNLVVVLGQRLIPTIQNGTKILLPFVTVLAMIAGGIALAPILALTAAIAGIGVAVVTVTQKGAQFIEWLKNLTAVKTVVKFIEDIVDKIKNGQNVILAVIDSFVTKFKKLQDAWKNGKVTPKTIGDDIKKSLDDIINKMGPLRNVFNFIKETVMAIGDILFSVGKGIVDFAKSLSPMERALLILSAAFTVGVIQIGKAAMNLSSITKATFDALGGVLGGVKGILSQYQKVVRTEIFVKWAYVIGVIAGSLALLAQCDPSKVKAAAGALSAVTIVLFGAVAGIEHLTDKLAQGAANWGTAVQMMLAIGVAFVGLGGGVAFLTAALVAMVNTKASIASWIGSMFGLVVMMASLGASIWALSKFMVNTINPTTSLAFVSFALAITMLAHGFAKLTATLDNSKAESISAGIRILEESILGLAGVMLVTSLIDNAKAAGLGILGFCASIYLILLSIEKIMSMIHSEQDYTMAIAITAGVLAGLVGLAFLLDKLAQVLNIQGFANVKGLGLTLLSFVGAVYLLIGAVEKFNELKPSAGAMGAFNGFIAVLALSVGALVALSHFAGDKLASVGGVLVAFAVAVSILTLTITNFAEWFDKNISAGVAAGLVVCSLFFLGITALLGLILTATRNVRPAFTTLLGIAAVLGTTTWCMILLSHLTIPGAIKGVAILGVTMLGLVKVLEAIGKLSDFKASIKGIVAMIAPILALAGGIIAIAMLGGDWTKIASASLGLGFCIAILGEVADKLSQIGTLDLRQIAKFGAFTLSLLPIAFAIGLLSHFGGEWYNVATAAGALSIAVLALSEAYRRMGSIGATDPALGIKVLEMCGGMVLIATAIGGLMYAIEKWGSLKSVSLAVGSLLFGVLAVSGAVVAMNKFQIQPVNAATWAGACGSLLIIATAIGGLMYAIETWGSPESVGLAIGGLVAGVLAVSGAIFVISKSTNVVQDFKAIGVFAAACATLYEVAGAIAMLAYFVDDMENATLAALAMGGCLIAVATALNIAKTAPWEVAGSLALACVPLLEIAFALKLVSDYDWEEMAHKLGVMAIAIGILAAVMTVVGVGSGVTSYMLVGAGIIAGSLAILEIGMVGFVAEAVYFADAVERFANAMKSLETLSLDGFMSEVEKLTTLPGITEQFNQLQLQFTAAIGAMEGPIKLAWSNLATTVQEHAKAAMYGMGYNSIHSAIDGIDSAMDDLYTVSLKAAERSVAGYCAGIKDPPPGHSQEFDIMGQIEMTSAAGGIERTTPLLVNTSQNAAKSSTDAFKGTLYEEMSTFDKELSTKYATGGVLEMTMETINKDSAEAGKQLSQTAKDAFAEDIKDQSKVQDGLMDAAEMDARFAGEQAAQNSTDIVNQAKDAIVSKIAETNPEIASAVLSLLNNIGAAASGAAYGIGAGISDQMTQGFLDHLAIDFNSSYKEADKKAATYLYNNSGKYTSKYGSMIGQQKLYAELDKKRVHWERQEDIERNAIKQRYRVPYWDEGVRGYVYAIKEMTKAEYMEAKSLAESNKAMHKTQTRTQATTEATEDLTTAIGDMDNAAGKAGGGGGGLAQEANALENLVDTIEGQINIFEEFNAETDLTKEKLLANMKSQIDGVINWSTKLSELATKGVEQGLLQKLADMGPQGWKYVNAFSTMTTEELQEANKLWDQSLILPQSAANQIGISFNMAGQMATKGYVEGLDPNCGNEIAKAMGQNSLESIMAALGEHSPSTKMREIGIWADEGFILGVKDKEKDIMTLITTIGTNVTEEFRTQVSIDKWTSIGTDAMLGFQKGIKDKEADILKLVESIGKKATEKLKTKGMDEHSPSASWEGIGAYAMIGLMNGFKGYEDSALNYVSGVGSKITDAMSYVISTANQIIEDSVDPVITPRLNLSNLNGQAGLIDRMLGRHKINAMVAAQNYSDGANPVGSTYNFTINSTAMDPKSLAREIEKVIIRR